MYSVAAVCYSQARMLRPTDIYRQHRICTPLILRSFGILEYPVNRIAIETRCAIAGEAIGKGIRIWDP